MPTREDPNAQTERKQPVWGVGEFHRVTKQIFEAALGNVWVFGEVAEVFQSSAGHIYFTLCDTRENALLKAVIFRREAMRYGRAIKNGARIQMLGEPTIFEQKGQLQFIAREIKAEGIGDLAQALAERKARLAEEGLFDEARKMPLPNYPFRIGLITSDKGAAHADVLSILRARFPVHVLFAPCSVQGIDALPTLLRSFDRVERAKPDVILLVRGGGADADLSVFNEEALVRRISSCSIPVITGVGHETDITLVDFVSDKRAATPTHAAEMAVPKRSDLLSSLEHSEKHLARNVERHLLSKERRLSQARARLSTPQERLSLQQRLLDSKWSQLQQSMLNRIKRFEQSLSQSERILRQESPMARLQKNHALLSQHQSELEAIMQSVHLARSEKRWATLAGKLHALSPLAVLERGYSIALDQEGHALVSTDQTKVGDAISVRLHQGKISARVESVEPSE